MVVVTVLGATVLAGCPNPPTVTSVGKSVTTLQKTFKPATCQDGDPAVTLPTEPQVWWNAMPVANHQYPFAGWEAFQNAGGGCAATRVDAYRAVVTFNLAPASISSLKGQVQKAALVVETRALPSLSTGGPTVAFGALGQSGTVGLNCVKNQGGAGALVRFGPAAPAPLTTPNGNFEMLGSNAFPSGTNTVYTFPTSVAPGSVANATDATTASLIGSGGSIYTTDVSAAVTAALNANAATLTWMLTSDVEGPLPNTLKHQRRFRLQNILQL